MRGEISENSIEHYCDPKDLIELPSPGDGQLEKRRSTLYKCRSVEDFASSSSYEVSQDKWDVATGIRGEAEFIQGFIQRGRKRRLPPEYKIYTE